MSDCECNCKCCQFWRSQESETKAQAVEEAAEKLQADVDKGHDVLRWPVLWLREHAQQLRDGKQ